ncbi:MAG: flagellar basal-body MS-ring/collar protein FliF [Acidimicrobiales bacterium]
MTARGRMGTIGAGFTMGQKVMTGVAVLGVVVGGFLFTKLESQPSYQPLFTNLSASDAGAITSQLTSQKVPYQLADGGTTVLVPSNDVDQERVALAQQGLPEGSNVGFSNLEKSGITSSQFVQQVEYQQALESQLAQTIESIQGVQSAQVSLNVPQQSDFVIGNQPTTTASVLVNLTPGTVLTSDQVAAIVHLAASSTPGLSTSDVTVVDNHGDVLNAPGVASGGSGGSNTDQTNDYDAEVAGSITSLLDKVVGPGNAAVQVHALLDFDQVNTTTNGLQLGPDGKPVTAPTGTSTSVSTGAAAGGSATGVVGTTTATTTPAGNSNSTSTQVTNAVGQVTETVAQAPGKVEQTSVAVLLNSSATKHVKQAEIQSLVTAAAGLNLAAGDQLVVSSMAFAPATAGQAGALGAGGSAAGGGMGSMIQTGGLVLLIGGMLFFGLWASKKRKPLYQEVPVGALTQGMTMTTLDEDDPTGEIPVSRRSVALELGPDAVLAQVNNIVEQRPAEAARLLRMWAEERKDSDKSVSELRA